MRTEVDIPFVAGLEQATRDEARDPLAGFTRLENVVQRKRGAYTKRTGYAALASHPGPSTAALASHRDEALIAIDGLQLHAYSSAANTWSTRGRIPGSSVERYSIASAGIFRGTVVYDVAAAGGLLVVIYETARALFAVVLDADTHAPVRGPDKLEDGLSGVDALQEFAASLVVVGTRAFCIYNRENVVALTREDAIYARMIDLAAPSAGWGAALTLVGGGVIDLTFGTFVLDACGLTDRFALAYRTLAGGVNVGTYDDTGTLITLTLALGAAAGTLYSFAVAGDVADTLWVARIATGDSRVDVEARDPVSLALTGTLLASAFPAQLTGSESNSAGAACALVRTAAGRAMLVVSGGTTAAGDYERNWIGWRELEVSAGAVAAYAAASVAQHLEHVTRPWLTASGRVYVVAVPFDTFDAAIPSAPIEVASATNRQRCMYVLDVTEPRSGDVPPVASIAPRVCGERGMLYLPRYTRHVAELAGGRIAWVFPSLRSASAETLEVAEVRPWEASQSGELGGLLHMAGGCAWSYDGSKTVEVAFLQAPRVKLFTAIAGGLTGTYLYSALWEHVDAAGNVHASEPAAPVSVALAAQVARMRITTPTLTLRDDRVTGADRVRCVLYRTAAGGTTYYRCAEAWAGDPASTSNMNAFVQFTDSMSDATLTQRARMYTQPGTLGTSLPRRAPPALRSLVQHGDTLAGIADDGRTIWFSAPVVGGEGQWFQDLFVAEVNDVSPLVALASFDGRLWAFTRSGVWVVDGQGFAENGTGGYSLPARVPVDVGCIEARSVVVTPNGALFLSELGIAMLSRSGQVSFFGETVGDVTDAYPVCTSAVLEAAENHVVFSLRSADGLSGVLLVYDYLSGAWTTETVPADAATRADGMYTRAVGAALARRNDGTYSPWAGQVIETGWLKVGGMQGFQRVSSVRVLFTRRSPAGLRVSFAHDYSGTYTDVREYSPSEVEAAAGQMQIAPVRQRCQAFRVRLEELAPDPSELGSEQGLEFTGLRLTAMVKRRPGFAKLQKD